MSETSISIQNFIDNSISIPFRFFKFKYQNENIFKIKSINLSDQITLSFQCEKYISFLLREYKRLFQEYDNNSISKQNNSNNNTNSELISDDFNQGIPKIKFIYAKSI